MKVNYIIVGSGLAGTLFCQKLKEQNKSFIVIDDDSQQSSTVAAGMYNPVILKRFTAVWRAQEQLNLAMPIYNQLEKELNIRLNYKVPIYRLFSSIEEQNKWFEAADNPILSNYLSTELVYINHDCIKSDFGFGKVIQTGRIDTKTLIENYKLKLESTKQLYSESFDYNDLDFTSTHVKYQNIEANHIVFAEGFGMKNNPFFNELPLNGTKGELLTIHAPELKIDYVIKSSMFLIPIGNDLYRVGATYERSDKSNLVTEKAKNELVNKLRTFLKCDFSIVDQHAGIRPTVIDRRPLVGRHDEFKNVYVLNGLGTRGVMIAPYVAKQLFNLIEKNETLNPEIDIKRFN